MGKFSALLTLVVILLALPQNSNAVRHQVHIGAAISDPAAPAADTTSTTTTSTTTTTTATPSPAPAAEPTATTAASPAPTPAPTPAPAPAADPTVSTAAAPSPAPAPAADPTVTTAAAPAPAPATAAATATADATAATAPATDVTATPAPAADASTAAPTPAAPETSAATAAAAPSDDLIVPTAAVKAPELSESDKLVTDAGDTGKKAGQVAGAAAGAPAGAKSGAEAAKKTAFEAGRAAGESEGHNLIEAAAKQAEDKLKAAVDTKTAIFNDRIAAGPTIGKAIGKEAAKNSAPEVAEHTAIETATAVGNQQIDAIEPEAIATAVKITRDFLDKLHEDDEKKMKQEIDGLEILAEKKGEAAAEEKFKHELDSLLQTVRDGATKDTEERASVALKPILERIVNDRNNVVDAAGKLAESTALPVIDSLSLKSQDAIAAAKAEGKLISEEAAAQTAAPAIESQLKDAEKKVQEDAAHDAPALASTFTTQETSSAVQRAADTIHKFTQDVASAEVLAQTQTFNDFVEAQSEKDLSIARAAANNEAAADSSTIGEKTAADVAQSVAKQIVSEYTASVRQGASDSATAHASEESNNLESYLKPLFDQAVQAGVNIATSNAAEEARKVAHDTANASAERTMAAEDSKTRDTIRARVDTAYIQLAKDRNDLFNKQTEITSSKAKDAASAAAEQASVSAAVREQDRGEAEHAAKEIANDIHSRSIETIRKSVQAGSLATANGIFAPALKQSEADVSEASRQGDQFGRTQAQTTGDQFSQMAAQHAATQNVQKFFSDGTTETNLDVLHKLSEEARQNALVQGQSAAAVIVNSGPEKEKRTIDVMKVAENSVNRAIGEIEDEYNTNNRALVDLLEGSKLSNQQAESSLNSIENFLNDENRQSPEPVSPAVALDMIKAGGDAGAKIGTAAGKVASTEVAKNLFDDMLDRLEYEYKVRARNIIRRETEAADVDKAVYDIQTMRAHDNSERVAYAQRQTLRHIKEAFSSLTNTYNWKLDSLADEMNKIKPLQELNALNQPETSFLAIEEKIRASKVEDDEEDKLIAQIVKENSESSDDLLQTPPSQRMGSKIVQDLGAIETMAAVFAKKPQAPSTEVDALTASLQAEVEVESTMRNKAATSVEAEAGAAVANTVDQVLKEVQKQEEKKTGNLDYVEDILDRLKTHYYTSDLKRPTLQQRPLNPKNQDASKKNKEIKRLFGSLGIYDPEIINKATAQAADKNAEAIPEPVANLPSWVTKSYVEPEMNI